MKKRTNGSARLRKAKLDRNTRWQTEGLTIGSLNCAGASLFKLKMILDTHTLDILCLQETWLPKSSVKLDIPGYLVYEERRAKDRRGGIAIIIRKGIKIKKRRRQRICPGSRHTGSWRRATMGRQYLPSTCKQPADTWQNGGGCQTRNRRYHRSHTTTPSICYVWGLEHENRQPPSKIWNNRHS